MQKFFYTCGCKGVSFFALNFWQEISATKHHKNVEDFWHYEKRLSLSCKDVTTKSVCYNKGVTGYLKLGEQVVMRRLLFCQKLGGQLPIHHLRSCPIKIWHSLCSIYVCVTNSLFILTQVKIMQKQPNSAFKKD